MRVLDIHRGVDNIFPHHENEIAQSEGATGEPFVSIWCHSAHLKIGGEKMAKSAANFSTLNEIWNTSVRASAVRYLLAARAPDRKPLNYTDDALDAAGEDVNRLRQFLRVRDLAPGGEPTPKNLGADQQSMGRLLGTYGRRPQSTWRNRRDIHTSARCESPS